jgi:hypothetical protein
MFPSEQNILAYAINDFQNWTECREVLALDRTLNDDEMLKDVSCKWSLLCLFTLDFYPPTPPLFLFFFFRSTDFFRFYVQSNPPVTFRCILQAAWPDVSGSAQHTLEMQLSMHVATQARELRTHCPTDVVTKTVFFNSHWITTAILLFVP